MKPQIKKDICDKLQKQWQVLEREAQEELLRVYVANDGSITFRDMSVGNAGNLVLTPPYSVAIEGYRMMGLLEMLCFMHIGFCTVNGRWKIFA